MIDDKIIKGRDVFPVLKDELQLIFQSINKHTKEKLNDSNVRARVESAYSIFYYGINDKNSWTNSKGVPKKTIKELEALRDVDYSMNTLSKAFVENELRKDQISQIMGNFIRFIL